MSLASGNGLPAISSSVRSRSSSSEPPLHVLLVVPDVRRDAHPTAVAADQDLVRRELLGDRLWVVEVRGHTRRSRHCPDRRAIRTHVEDDVQNLVNTQLIV